MLDAIVETARFVIVVGWFQVLMFKPEVTRPIIWLVCASSCELLRNLKQLDLWRMLRGQTLRCYLEELGNLLPKRHKTQCSTRLIGHRRQNYWLSYMS